MRWFCLILSLSSCHCYHVVRDHLLSWHDAQTYCEEHCHSNLASVHNDDDMFSLQNITASIPNADGIWIGLSDLESSTVWKWIDGTELDYGFIASTFPWSPGNPSNDEDEDCGWISAEVDYQWDDYKCSNQLPFVCNACHRPNYYLSPNALSLNSANYHCIEHCDSTLASIHSIVDNEFAINLVSNAMIHKEYDIWIGLNYSIADDEYRWTDGTAFDFGSTFGDNEEYNPWNSNMTEGTLDGVSSPCIAMSASSPNKWKIKSGSECSDSMRFLCNSCSGKLNKVIVVDHEPLPFNESQEICHRVIGTEMVSLHRSRDHAEARSLCEHYEDADCWIGLKQKDGNQSIFEWEDGTDWNFGLNLGSSPWKHKPNMVDTHTLCVGLDEGSGYKWEDDDCLEDKDVLCNAPSTLCYGQHWNGIDETAHFNSCTITMDASSSTKNGITIMNTGRTWVNQNGIFELELMSKMVRNSEIADHENREGIFSVNIYSNSDEMDFCSFYEIGIKETFPLRQLFIIKYTNSIPEVIQIVNLIETETATPLLWDLWRVRIINGTAFSVWINNQRYISFIDNSTDSNSNHLLYPKYQETMIGLKALNSKFIVRSLYVSGTEVALDNTTHSDFENYYNLCDFPTTIITPSPLFIPNPTTAPTVFDSRTISPTASPTVSALNPLVNINEKGSGRKVSGTALMLIVLASFVLFSGLFLVIHHLCRTGKGFGVKDHKQRSKNKKKRKVHGYNSYNSPSSVGKDYAIKYSEMVPMNDEMERESRSPEIQSVPKLLRNKDGTNSAAEGIPLQREESEDVPDGDERGTDEEITAGDVTLCENVNSNQSEQNSSCVSMAYSDPDELIANSTKADDGSHNKLESYRIGEDEFIMFSDEDVENGGRRRVTSMTMKKKLLNSMKM